MSAVMDGWEGMILTLKSIGLQKCFPKGLENNTSGTGGNVPWRYGEKLEKLFWPY
jgi:hypothetical protein